MSTFPPRSAFNETGTLLNRKIFGHGWGFSESDRNDGAGAYTLCRSCNNYTGAYAENFAKFVKQIAPAAETIDEGDSGILVVKTKPLFIVKQLLSLFCSINTHRFIERHLWLKKYLLDVHNNIWGTNDMRIYVVRVFGGSKAVLRISKYSKNQTWWKF